jgi:hypothetical protein
MWVLYSVAGFVEELESLSDGNYAAFEDVLHTTTMKLFPFTVDSKTLTGLWSPSTSTAPGLMASLPTESPGSGHQYGSFCMEWFHNTSNHTKNRMKIERQLSSLGVNEVVSLWQSREQSMELFIYFLDHMNFEGIVEWCRTVTLFPRVSLVIVENHDAAVASTHSLGVKYDEQDESHEGSHIERQFGWEYEELTEFVTKCLESEESFLFELVRDNLGTLGIILPDERSLFHLALRRLILSTSFFSEASSSPVLMLGEVSLSDIFPSHSLSAAHELCMKALVDQRDHEGAIRYLTRFSLIDGIDFSGMFSGDAGDWIKFVQRMSSSSSPHALEVSRLNLSQLEVKEKRLSCLTHISYSSLVSRNGILTLLMVDDDV